MEKVLPQQRGNFFCLKCPGFWIVVVCAEGEPRKLPLLLQKKTLLFSNFCSIMTFERTFSLGSNLWKGGGPHDPLG